MDVEMHTVNDFGKKKEINVVETPEKDT